MISAGTIIIALGQPTFESKVVQIVQVAEDASQEVGNLIDLIYSNARALEVVVMTGK